MDRSVLVLYGSETGNAQDMAEELGRLCQRLHFRSEVEELDAVELVSRQAMVSRGPSSRSHGALTESNTSERPRTAPTRHVRHLYHGTGRHAAQLAPVLEEAASQETAPGVPRPAEIHLLRSWRQYIRQVFCPSSPVLRLWFLRNRVLI